jgi:hypothetical protein
MDSHKRPVTQGQAAREAKEGNDTEKAEPAPIFQATKYRKRKFFARFPDLPVELRLSIWKTGCFESRNVDFERVTQSFPTTYNSRSNAASRYRSQTAIPPILHTSQESRSEALKHYSLEFGTMIENQRLTLIIPPRV